MRIKYANLMIRAFCLTLWSSPFEENCRAMPERIYREGNTHLLIGETSGMLVWQETDNGAEIVAIHSLPESRGYRTL